MPRRIAVGDDEYIRSMICALRTDVGNQRCALVSVRGPIQPDGQQLPAAIALAAAWQNKMGGLEEWYARFAADLAAVECQLVAARTLHQGVEEISAAIAQEALS